MHDQAWIRFLSHFLFITAEIGSGTKKYYYIHII